jgi:hypothetical protein
MSIHYKYQFNDSDYAEIHHGERFHLDYSFSNVKYLILFHKRPVSLKQSIPKDQLIFSHGIFFTFMVICGGILALFQMTHINELEEIKNDNIVISLLSSSILLGLALIMDQYVGHLCEAIVPYPDIISIH